MVSGGRGAPGTASLCPRCPRSTRAGTRGGTGGPRRGPFVRRRGQRGPAGPAGLGPRRAPAKVPRGCHGAGTAPVGPAAGRDLRPRDKPGAARRVPARAGSASPAGQRPALPGSRRGGRGTRGERGRAPGCSWLRRRSLAAPFSLTMES